VDLAEARALFDRRRLAWLAGDVDGYLDCWHDDLVLHLPGSATPVVGRDAYRSLVERSNAWARPVSFEVHHLAVDGDVVLAEWTITALRLADDVEVTWTGMNAALIEAGRIRWWREYQRGPSPR
jgi:uncharacterized protein (TIGR02246 family)